MSATAQPHPHDHALPPRESLVPSAVVYLLLFTAVGCWSAYATVLYAEQGLDLATVGLLASLTSAVAIFAAPTWGLLADRIGDVRPPLLAAALWGASAAALLALRPSMPWIALVAVAIAVGTTGLTPLVDARSVERLGRERDRFGQVRAVGSAGFIAATLAVGFIVQAAGTHAMLAVYVPALALTGIIGAAVLGGGSGAARAAGVGPTRALRLLREPGMGLFFVGSIVVWTASVGVMTFFSLRLIELGGDARLVGLGWAANAILEIPTMLLFRRLVGRAPVAWLLVAGSAVFVVRSVLFTAVASAAGLVIGAALGGVGFALFLVGTTTFVARRAPAELRATAQALFSSTAFAFGSILGAILGGQVAGLGGLAAVFPAGVVTSLVGTAFIWLAVVRRGVPVPVPSPSPTGR